jgi:hypothetical protein
VIDSSIVLRGNPMRLGKTQGKNRIEMQRKNDFRYSYGCYSYYFATHITGRIVNSRPIEIDENDEE